MSITAKLHIDEKEFNILQFRYSIAQNSDYSGYPSAKPTGGIWSIVFESTKEGLFYEWMVAENTMKNLEIVLAPTAMNGKTRSIKLYDVYCIKYMENFDGVNSRPMSTYIEISPAIMEDGGTKIFEKYWKVSNPFGKTATPTIINEDEDEPNFIGHHFENEEEDEIKKEEIEVDDIIYLVIESENAIGETINIDLDDGLKDYEYQGKVIENDKLEKVIIIDDVFKLKLKAIKQKK